MHEYSIVQALLDQCDGIARENSAEKVTKVVIKIGVLSGVEADLLQTAYDTFREGTVCAEAELQIDKQQVKLHCNGCSEEFEIDDFSCACVACGGTDVRVIDGEEMYLMSLEMA